MFRRWPFLSDEERFRRLEHELYIARRAVLSLLPDDLQRRFESYYECKDRHAAHQWERSLIDVIIERAKPLSREDGSYFGPRGYCPLCGDGSTSPYDRGFALPEGLYRHLSGSGNTGQCHVFETVLSQARDYWEPRFQEIEAAEQEVRQAELTRRRDAEPLFRIAPDEDPKLRDEGLYSETAREDSSLFWAMDRLADLGFARDESERTVAVTKEHAEFVVFADPRPAGKLLFRVYPTDPRKRARRRSSMRPQMAQFEIPDSWKNDLPTKLGDRLSRAIELLRPKQKGQSTGSLTRS